MLPSEAEDNRMVLTEEEGHQHQAQQVLACLDHSYDPMYVYPNHRYHSSSSCAVVACASSRLRTFLVYGCVFGETDGGVVYA